MLLYFLFGQLFCHTAVRLKVKADEEEVKFKFIPQDTGNPQPAHVRYKQ